MENAVGDEDEKLAVRNVRDIIPTCPVGFNRNHHDVPLTTVQKKNQIKIKNEISHARNCIKALERLSGIIF